MAASVPTCFPNGFEWVPVDSMAAPREDCFAVFCLPHRIVAFSNGFQGFSITVGGCVLSPEGGMKEMHGFPMVLASPQRCRFLPTFSTKGP